MKSKTMIFRILAMIACFLCASGGDKSFGEEQNKSKNKIDTSAASFEQALKNYDFQKQKDQEELAGKLNFNLGQATESWINAAKKDKTGKLNTRLEQAWEKLARSYPISPAHYEYYLRGYKYSIVKNDIIKTDSLISFYKALVIIKEELYVEKNHSPNISDANPYFYTVSSNYTLNFEFKNKDFSLVNSDSKIISIENDCPEEVKKLRL